MGQTGGKLSLMSFRIIQPASLRGTSYLCDVLSLTSAELRPVYDILESSEIQKVVFDGRMDFSCLLHYHGVRLQNIIDLQLADVESRARRGERFEGQISRFPKFVSRFDVNVNPGKYRAIHKLSGLTQCAAEHNLIPQNVTKKNFDHQMWMNRPFKHTHLEYAAYDVELIDLIHAKFVSAGPLYRDIPQDSLRYVGIYENEPKGKGDRARNHCFLPLNIIHGVDNPVESRRCTGCRRTLPLSCFQAGSLTYPTHHYCHVCFLVL